MAERDPGATSAGDPAARQAAVAPLVAPRPSARISSETLTSDAHLLRRVRLRLVAWSGGITLAILLVLGTILYISAARTLASGAETLLNDRARVVTNLLQRASGPPDPRGTDRFATGFAFGGPGSGSFAVVVTPNGLLIGPRDSMIQGLPNTAGLDAARKGQTTSQESVLGEVPVRVLSVPVDLSSGTYVVQVIGDRTTEQRTLQALLLVLGIGGLAALALAVASGMIYARRALVPIRESMRRQRDFAADASHELRTPLTILRASVDDLRRHAGSPVRKVGTALDDITAETDHLTGLVDGLLLLARADSGAIEVQRVSLDLADVAAGAMGELSHLAATQQVTLQLDARPTAVSGDPARLRQLVVLLVDNAIRHARGPANVEVHVGSEGREALLRVDDTGPGIRPDDLPHLFERFWRAADSPPGGMGLGLSIAAWIAERHGGRIAAEQRPEGGARFSVRLPLTT